MGNCPSVPKCPEFKCDTQQKIGVGFDETVSAQTTEIIGIINEIFQNFQYSLCRDEKMEKWKNMMKKEANKARADPNLPSCEEMKKEVKKQLSKPPFTTDQVTAKLLQKLSDKILEIYCKDKSVDLVKLLDDISKTVCSDSLTGEKVNISTTIVEEATNTLQIVEEDEEGESASGKMQYRIRGLGSRFGVETKSINCFMIFIIILIVMVLISNRRNLRNKFKFF